VASGGDKLPPLLIFKGQADKKLEEELQDLPPVKSKL